MPVENRVVTTSWRSNWGMPAVVAVEGGEPRIAGDHVGRLKPADILHHAHQADVGGDVIGRAQVQDAGEGGEAPRV